MPSLEFRDAVKTSGGKMAVAGVSFEVVAGEVCGLLRPDGAGKTTPMRTAMDILRPDRGAISVNERTFRGADHGPTVYRPEERRLYCQHRSWTSSRTVGASRAARDVLAVFAVSA